MNSHSTIPLKQTFNLDYQNSHCSDILNSSYQSNTNYKSQTGPNDYNEYNNFGNLNHNKNIAIDRHNNQNPYYLIKHDQNNLNFYATSNSTFSNSVNSKNSIFSNHRRSPSISKNKSPSHLSGRTQRGRPFNVPDCYVALPKGKKYIAINLLNQQSIILVIDDKYTDCQSVLEYACSLIGLSQSEFFGLAQLVYFDSGMEYKFLEPEDRIASSRSPSSSWINAATKSFRSLNKNAGMYCKESNHPLIRQPSLQLYLRVKFYTENPQILIKDKIALTHYYLQMKENVLKDCQIWEESKCYILAAYALLSDCQESQKPNFTQFDPYNYLPKWVVKLRGLTFPSQHLPSILAQLSSSEPLQNSTALSNFIIMASGSGSRDRHDLHYYKLFKKSSRRQIAEKIDKIDDNKRREPGERGADSNVVWLGVSSLGIHFYEDNGSLPRILLSTFKWGDIDKLSFDKDKFEIKHIDNFKKFSYYTGNDERSKYLLDLCKSTHIFNLSIKKLTKTLSALEINKKCANYNNHVRPATPLLNGKIGNLNHIKHILSNHSNAVKSSPPQNKSHLNSPATNNDYQNGAAKINELSPINSLKSEAHFLVLDSPHDSQKSDNMITITKRSEKSDAFKLEDIDEIENFEKSETSNSSFISASDNEAEIIKTNKSDTFFQNICSKHINDNLGKTIDDDSIVETVKLNTETINHTKSSLINFNNDTSQISIAPLTCSPLLSNAHSQSINIPLNTPIPPSDAKKEAPAIHYHHAQGLHNKYVKTPTPYNNSPYLNFSNTKNSHSLHSNYDSKSAQFSNDSKKQFDHITMTNDAKNDVAPLFAMYTKKLAEINDQSPQFHSQYLCNTSNENRRIKQKPPPPSYTEAIMYKKGLISEQTVLNEMGLKNGDSGFEFEIDREKNPHHTMIINDAKNRLKEMNNLVDVRMMNGGVLFSDEKDTKKDTADRVVVKHSNPASCSRIKSFSSHHNTNSTAFAMTKWYSSTDINHEEDIEILLNEIKCLRELPPLMKALFKEKSLF
ncbi:unnamed protein product [Gordionus sp. m RMFG-2023]|uniref:uncharacterized protein LOC135931674 n=1 Tax=Gordionus sp. m RMFG-2023 TaxID=3053472 RepID=UPI0030E5A89E